ncbi:MAG: ketopantoate reductase family protein [Phascolarctobacterium sp.]|nr:ketopantoate reductase family protein [Phascolarctobacterium sp.]
MKINKVAIVGMGALGLMYGEHIQNAGTTELCFIMDKERKARHLHDKYIINDVEKQFKLVSPEEGMPVDLIIVATKFGGLKDAMEEMAPFVGPDTIIFSVLNGITSEELMMARFGTKNILHCVVLGMDAVREGTILTYQHKGVVKIGAVAAENQAALTQVCEFFESIALPYSKEQDILHALWAKLLLNVGINQTCMIYETSYGGAFDNEEARTNMYAAMHEVIDVAKAEGVNLTEADFEGSVKVLKGLAYDGLPSMRQDGLAKRKTEVDLFAGTIVALGKKHNIPTPVNCFYYQRVKEMEAKY